LGHEQQQQLLVLRATGLGWYIGSLQGLPTSTNNSTRQALLLPPSKGRHPPPPRTMRSHEHSMHHVLCSPLILQRPPQADRGGTSCTHRGPGPRVRLGGCRHALQRVCAPCQAPVGALAAPSTARQAARGAVPATAAACDASRANSSRQAPKQGACGCASHGSCCQLMHLA
jgi:hypothetical protein